MEIHNNDSQNFIQDLIANITKIKHRHFFARQLVNTISSLLYSVSISFLVFFLSHQRIFLSLILGCLAFLILFFTRKPRKLEKPLESSLLLSLDIAFPDRKTSIYKRDLWDKVDFQNEWKDTSNHVLFEIHKEEKNKTRLHLRTLVPACVLALVFGFGNGLSFFRSSVDLMKSFANRGVKLRILQGDLDGIEGKISLNPHKNLRINLGATNLIEVEFLSLSFDQIPNVETRKDPNDPNPFQNFQMIDERKNDSHTFSIQFSVSESSFLSIPQFAGGKSLVQFLVQKSENPKVHLQALHPIPELWDDDKALNVLVKVDSKHPLQTVNLLVTVGGQKFREPIFSANGEPTNTLETHQPVFLEKYLDRDFAKVEIRAEAIDQTLPNPLVGFSQPLVIQTISSYGRYRKTLMNLRTIKEKLDTAILKSNPNLVGNQNEAMEQIQKDARSSPFFDSVDRSRIDKLESSLKANEQSPELKNVYHIAHQLSSFLEEHEMLDDRERDRDFFVAARGLSHLLDSGIATKDIVKVAEEKILIFLVEREKRWKRRIQRLARPHVLKHAHKVVEKHHFSQQFEKMIQNPKQKKETLRILSEEVSYYRQWIDELEAAEDKEREEREKERQSGLVSAREELKQLQKRQLDVSKKLHASDTRPQEELKKEWPVARMYENSNVQDSKKLEEKLNALAPRSADRLSAAIEAMKLTVQSGEDSEFAQAESFADLASRLLHQASKMTEQEQQNSRKPYRSGSDKYYGQSIVGGDIEIEHDYRVDPRYREDVLDEVIKSDYQGDSRVILNNFLKRIIR